MKAEQDTKDEEARKGRGEDDVRKVLWNEEEKKRKSLESVSEVVMVFLCIKTWLKIRVDHLQNE